MHTVPQNISPFRAAGTELLNLGYSVIPVSPGEKFPGAFVNGHWQPLAGWQRFRASRPTVVDVMRWKSWPDAGVGIPLGWPVGDGTIVIAIDLDMRDPAQVARAVAALPKTPMSKTGAKGETLFFRAPPETKTGVYDRILDEVDDKGKRKRERLADFLAAGRQTVAPPSAHPDGNGLTYRWLRGPVAAADLPLFDERAMKAFQNVMRSLGWPDTPQDNAPPGVTRAPRPTTPRASTEVVDLSTSIYNRLNAAALADLDAWVPELDLYRCQKARNGYEAVATWRASTTGRADEKRKRNLSIQPNGIEDFGAATKYSPLDLVMCAKGLTFAAAYEWLRACVAPVDDSGVVMALKTNVAPPDSDEDDDVTEIVITPTDEGLPPPVKSQDLAPAFFDDDLSMKEFPEDRCFPVGLVGQVARWIADTSTTPVPILAYGAALVLVGTVAGRQFQGPTGTGTHLYIIGCAPTGVGKDHPMQCVSTALHDAGMANMIGPPDYTADSAVLRHLTDNPLSVSLIDEFGSFWKRINSKKSGSWETAITRALREPWGRSFGLMRTKQYAGAGPQSRDIWWPALSIIGMTTPGEFFNALSAADIENGMVNRLLVLVTARRPEDCRTRDEVKAAYFSRAKVDLSTPMAIVEGLKAIQNWQSELIGPQFSWPTTASPTLPTVTCAISKDAGDLLFRYREWISIREREDEGFGKFYSRGAESAQRIAMIHAIGRAAVHRTTDDEPPLLTLVDVENAIRVVDWSLRNMWAAVSEHQQPTSIEEVARRIVDALRRRGGSEMALSQRDLKRALGASASSAFGDAVKFLVETEIIEVEVVGGGSGRRPTIYRLRDRSAYRG